MQNFSKQVSDIWAVANLLRGPYHPNQYKDIMLPMTVLRRLDCVLEPTKEDVLKTVEKYRDTELKNVEPILNKITKVPFHNTSRFTFERLKEDPDNLAQNLVQYIKSFSSRAQKVLEYFNFEKHIAKLEENNILFLLISKYCEMDLHPETVSNLGMGYIFEELIRKFYDASNEEAGDHFTPREVIRLMVDIIFLPDNNVLSTKGIIKTLFDPACGTGGMLSVAEDYLQELNPDAHLEVYGQDYNEQSYAICGSDMMIKDQNLDNIRYGNSFTNDQFAGMHFDYMLANPPFGVEWKKEKDIIEKEHEKQGFGGRFGAGLPRINDGQLLFIMHMMHKMKETKEGGTRLSIVFNGSPLFTGGAGSGESEIRRWIIENDMLEAIIALPDQLFYNTGISTYLWIVTNRKDPKRKGKVQLVNAVGFYKKMRKSLGNKRNEISEDQRAEIVRLYGEFSESEFVRIYKNTDFAYKRITVERPLKLNFVVDAEHIRKVRDCSAFSGLAESKKRKDKEVVLQEIEEGRKLQDKIIEALEKLSSLGVVQNRDKFTHELKAVLKKVGLVLPAPLLKGILSAIAERDETADVCKDAKGKPEADPELRDYENVPYEDEIDAYMKREVLPHVPDAWVDHEKTKVGYEVNFNRYFYKYVPPRPLKEIDAELKAIEAEIAEMLVGDSE